MGGGDLVRGSKRKEIHGNVGKFPVLKEEPWEVGKGVFFFFFFFFFFFCLYHIGMDILLFLTISYSGNLFVDILLTHH